MKNFLILIGLTLSYSTSFGMERTYLQKTVEVALKVLYKEYLAGNASAAQALDDLKSFTHSHEKKLSELGCVRLKQFDFINKKGNIDHQVIDAIKANINSGHYNNFDTYVRYTCLENDESSRPYFKPTQSNHNIYAKAAVNIACIKMFRLSKEGNVGAGAALDYLEKSIDGKIEIEGASKDVLREFGILAKDEVIISDTVIESLVENIFQKTTYTSDLLSKPIPHFGQYIELTVKDNQEALDKQKAALEGAK